MPLGAAVVTVELMLTLRVLALCELMNKLPSSHELVLIHCYFRWELNRKRGIASHEFHLVTYLATSRDWLVFSSFNFLVSGLIKDGLHHVCRWVSLIQSRSQSNGPLLLLSSQDSHYPEQEVRKPSSTY